MKATIIAGALMLSMLCPAETSGQDTASFMEIYDKLITINMDSSGMSLAHDGQNYPQSIGIAEPIRKILKEDSECSPYLDQYDSHYQWGLAKALTGFAIMLIGTGYTLYLSKTDPLGFERMSPPYWAAFSATLAGWFFQFAGTTEATKARDGVYEAIKIFNAKVLQKYAMKP